ncbi:hypothetical protein [Niastella sp. OAS944]|uniref:hypothetical protein n=1 Tax=Niastella sp. OAS944 TaxID=2664089 RepID=UPI0034717830|nr:hypothetical protein [Chitinophagaceae bacterium OAS944]
MAEAFAPFRIQRTIGKLTFYMMEGRNFVRKKSSLTRRKVLYSPAFENTRHNASVMGQASKIGSYLYNSLPVYWRQSWMYRSFTGEAYTMLKKGIGICEVRQFLWERYIKQIIDKKRDAQSSVSEQTASKRAYIKQDTNYWQTKTSKSIQRKVHKEQQQQYSDLLAEASAIASELYRELPPQSRSRCFYQELNGWAMKWLKEQEKDDVVEVVMTRTQKKKCSHIGRVFHADRVFYFLPPLKRQYPHTVMSLAPHIIQQTVQL